MISDCPSWLRPERQLVPRRPDWRSKIVLGQSFFTEVTRSAVPIDLRALDRLKASPFAMHLCTWLTYRMSYLKKTTMIPWESLQAQFGAIYARPRDFRRKAFTQLEEVIRVYPTLRVSQTDTGLRLHPSPPHVQRSRGSGHGSALVGQRLSSDLRSVGGCRSEVESTS